VSLEEGAARAWVLAFILMAGVGIGTLVGVGCLVGANVCPGKAQPKITATDGREIYVRAGCAGCHGNNGEGGRGPSLVSGRLASLSVEELSSRIANGKRLAGMPKFEDQLTPAQIRSVAQYVVTLRGGS
jgi:mono/diheme cytochrome c family protein